MPADTHGPGLSQPSGNTIVRRYLTDEKFMWLLRDSAIYLRQLAKFADDPFEGATPAKTKARIEQWIRESGVDPRSINPTTFPSYHARERHYVSCWFEGSPESNAMWKLYGGGKSSLAIETTYAQLVAEFDSEYWAGRVIYAGFDEIEDSTINDFNRVFLKRLEFAHEKEVRIAKRLSNFHKEADANVAKLMHKIGSKEWLDALYDQPDGINHPVQLHRVLNRVIVHPKADSARRSEVQEQLTRCGLSCAVAESTLSARPFLGYLV